MLVLDPCPTLVMVEIARVPYCIIGRRLRYLLQHDTLQFRAYKIHTTIYSACYSKQRLCPACEAIRGFPLYERPIAVYPEWIPFTQIRSWSGLRPGPSNLLWLLSWQFHACYGLSRGPNPPFRMSCRGSEENHNYSPRPEPVYPRCARPVRCWKRVIMRFRCSCVWTWVDFNEVLVLESR